MKKESVIGDGIREAVFGANDGAVSTFGILSGLVGASLASPVILLVGLVQMFAAGLSMGLGAYISTKSQNEFYSEERNAVRSEIDVHPAREKAELDALLRARGVKEENLKQTRKAFTNNKRLWLDFVLEERFGIADASFPHPVLAGGIMFVAFVFAGVFPLLPFVFTDPRTALLFSATLTLLLLFAVGAAKTRFTRRNPLLAGFENLLIGAITGVVGFVVGALVKSFL